MNENNIYFCYNSNRYNMKIAVILGSIREIRRGGRVAKCLMSQLAQFKDIEFELLDLKDYPLPFFNESNSPQGLEGNYTNETAKKWAAKIGEADAFIIITPEYNHGTSGVLKNPLDWVYQEWNNNQLPLSVIHQMQQEVSELLNNSDKLQ